MSIVIQKFGGTSVSTKDKRRNVIEKIIKAKKEGDNPVVVVSAMGRKGSPYATDTLLSMLSPKFLEENHQAVDSLMSCGEIITTNVICSELYDAGYVAVPLTGGQAGIITNNNFCSAEVIELRPEKIFNLIEDGIIPVIAGFQGITEDGFLTTLGRGGSDTSASLIGTAVNADKIEIYTDVDGIMTADPRIVKSASLIEEIGYNEVFQMAEQGAKVIHPRAVEIAMENNIPLYIKNTLSECTGTRINNVLNCKSNSVITAITHVDKRVQITVNGIENQDSEDYLYLLEILSENDISIDLINVFIDKSVFTIDEVMLEKFKKLMKKHHIKYSYITNCSKVSVIGNKMKGIPGVMSKVLKALKIENVTVLQTADSYNTIWCLIESTHVKKSINSLHNEFHLEDS